MYNSYDVPNPHGAAPCESGALSQLFKHAVYALLITLPVVTAEIGSPKVLEQLADMARIEADADECADNQLARINARFDTGIDEDNSLVMLIAIRPAGQGEFAQALQEVLVVVVFILHSSCLSLNGPDRAVEKRSPARFQFAVFILAAPASTAASSVSLARWE